VACAARRTDPDAKGFIERNHHYVETALIPGRAFTGPDDFNRQGVVGGAEHPP